MIAMRRAAWAVCLLLVWAGAGIRAAQAAPILVLGVQSDDHEDAKLSAALSEHAERSGEKVIKRPRLSTADRRCAEQSCLEKLARRFETNLVLGAQVKASNDTNRDLRIWLFDAATLQTSEVADLCTECTEERLGIVLRGMTGRLIRHYRAPEAPAPGAGTTPPAAGTTPPLAPGDPLADELPGKPAAKAEKPAVPSRPPGAAETIPEVNDLDPQPGAVAGINKGQAAPRPASSEGMPAWRKRLAIGLGVTAAATLVASIVLNAKDGALTGGSCSYMGTVAAYPDCVNNFTALYATGYAVTGALALGVVITLWPASSKDRR